MTTWTPQPGTLNHRAVEYLKTLPSGEWLASGPFAQAIGTDSATLSACLVTAVRHGAVRREKRNGLAWWALGDGKPERSSRSDDGPVVREAAGLDMDTVHRLAAKNNPFSGAVPDPEPDPEPEQQAPDPEPVPEAVPEPAAAEPEPAVADTPETPAPAASRQFQFSWCNNGELTLSKDGGTVVLTRQERDDLVHFVEVVQIYEATQP